MRFRVTSVADEGIGDLLNDPLVKIEDWLNAALGDGSFGSDLACLMIVVFAGTALRHAPAVSRLTSYRSPVTGQNERILALHVVVEPGTISPDPRTLLRQLSATLVEGLPAKPLRSPRGLEYGRLRAAINASLAAYAQHKA